MAGQAHPEENEELLPTAQQVREKKRLDLMQAAARLYGQGYERRHVSRMLLDHLVPNGLHRPEEQRLSQARNRLRKWEKSVEFRDMIYDLAVVKLDLQTPAILGGVARKAKRGRVDAARLALEITGRHNPKGEVQPAQVAIVFQGVPRPGDAQAVEAIEMEVVDEDDEV